MSRWQIARIFLLALAISMALAGLFAGIMIALLGWPP
jgi:hypothetical protein